MHNLFGIEQFKLPVMHSSILLSGFDVTMREAMQSESILVPNSKPILSLLRLFLFDLLWIIEFSLSLMFFKHGSRLDNTFVLFQMHCRKILELIVRDLLKLRYELCYLLRIEQLSMSFLLIDFILPSIYAQMHKYLRCRSIHIYNSYSAVS